MGPLWSRRSHTCECIQGPREEECVCRRARQGVPWEGGVQRLWKSGVCRGLSSSASSHLRWWSSVCTGPVEMLMILRDDAPCLPHTKAGSWEALGVGDPASRCHVPRMASGADLLAHLQNRRRPETLSPSTVMRSEIQLRWFSTVPVLYWGPK